MPNYTGDIAVTFKQMTSEAPTLNAAADDDQALIALIAHSNFPPLDRGVVIARIVAGAPLEPLGDELGRARWLNLVAAEALGDHFDNQPMKAAFAVSIAPHIPADIARQRVLIKVISVANACGDEHIALMLGKRIALDHYDPTEFEIALLAMYLAVNKDPDVPAHRLIPKHLRDDSSLQTLVRCAVCWFTWVLYETLFGIDGVADTYRPGGWHQGVNFLPLRTVEQFYAAAQRYNNCVSLMAPLLLRDVARVFDLIQNGVHLGLVEIRMGGVGDAFPQLRQLEGPEKQQLKPTYERAVFAMLASQPASGSLGRNRMTGHIFPQSKVLTARFRALLGPYLDTHTVSGYFPPQISKGVFEILLTQALELSSFANLDGVIGYSGRRRRV